MAGRTDNAVKGNKGKAISTLLLIEMTAVKLGLNYKTKQDQQQNPNDICGSRGGTGGTDPPPWKITKI